MASLSVPYPVLGNIAVDHFLNTYWQREPVVIRAAFPGIVDPLSPDELAGLACEDQVDSRLVIERGRRKAWEVTRGPQKAGVLRRLPPSHWTLLVESVDRHCAGIAAFAAPFSFLPKWRMDDVMVSLAPIEGTVDAHIDSYDVFLIQGQGRRKWEIDRRATPHYKPGLDLRILRRFRAEDTWILEPGDMLYVPPGVAHRGVTLPSDVEIALTYSVGFRAPSSADLLSGLLSGIVAGESPARFADPARKAAVDPGELSESDLADLRSFLLTDLETRRGDAWTLAAGETVTSGGIAHSARRVATRAVAERLKTGGTVSPVRGTRMCWARLERGRAALFVNGERRLLTRPQVFAASALCGRMSRASARRLGANRELASLVAELLRAGAVDWTA